MCFAVSFRSTLDISGFFIYNLEKKLKRILVFQKTSLIALNLSSRKLELQILYLHISNLLEDKV